MRCRNRWRSAVVLSSTSSAHKRMDGRHPLPNAGLKNVATEASLTILAYNLKRAIAVAGVAATLRWTNNCSSSPVRSGHLKI